MKWKMIVLLVLGIFTLGCTQKELQQPAGLESSQIANQSTTTLNCSDLIEGTTVSMNYDESNPKGIIPNKLPTIKNGWNSDNLTQLFCHHGSEVGQNTKHFYCNIYFPYTLHKTTIDENDVITSKECAKIEIWELAPQNELGQSSEYQIINMTCKKC